MALHQFLENSAHLRPNHIAVQHPAHGTITYGELDALADRLRDRLRKWDVRPGDRVAIYARKSIDVVAAIFGILKTGAAYVPLDPTAPIARNAYILNDCAVNALVVEEKFVEPFEREYRALTDPSQLGSVPEMPQMLVLPQKIAERPLAAALAREDERDPAAPTETYASVPNDLAYILYTSGSTGKPKGVMLSHRNGASFVNWCSETFQPTADDRFSQHAPFHFDLSILDLFLSIKHGATLVLIGEEIGKQPGPLAALIAEQRISIWYSAPTILSLLVQYGHLERYDYSSLRLLLFAGEVFPVKHLRELKSLIAHPRYFNLYGPTETNVCTYYEIPATISEDRTDPYPIGKTCSHLCSRVIDERGAVVARGGEGELIVSGSGVMRGYWNLPEQTERAFLVDEMGTRWYKTGDVVYESREGDYIFMGRRDRMVKRRGYRVELAEIEAALYRHPAIKEAAALAVADEESGVRVIVFLSCRDSAPPSAIELKRFCAEHLPAYMIPDQFLFQDALPKTSTDKMDYQRLKAMA